MVYNQPIETRKFIDLSGAITQKASFSITFSKFVAGTEISSIYTGDWYLAVCADKEGKILVKKYENGTGFDVTGNVIDWNDGDDHPLVADRKYWFFVNQVVSGKTFPITYGFFTTNYNS